MSSVALKSGLALLAIAGLTTGCAIAVEDDAATTPAQTPAEIVAKSAPGATTTPFSFTITGLDTEGDAQDIKGVSSPTTKSYDLTATYVADEEGLTSTMQFRVVDQSAWVKMKFSGLEGMPEMPDKWVVVDPSQAAADDSMPKGWTDADADPTGTDVLVDAVIDVTETGTGTYSGTLDLTKAEAADVVDLTKAGDTVKAVPFTATVDDSGRLTAITLKVPAIGEVAAFDYKVTFTYDGAKTIEAPVAAEVTEAPESLKDLLS
ncbi:hypothetical protein [Catenuloplanes japonicus]|uniref:hypothetical protein n=1 Tax=Catenuloplanes japonicus TaxID=33876 RepID=UPI0005255341|nr:hypothetical protein [Catenuloplanes japonicus]